MENENMTAAAVGSKGKNIVGMAMTVVGMVLSWMGLCGGFPGFLAIVLIIVGMLMTKAQPFKKVAKICGIVGICLSAVCIVAGFIIMIAGIFSVIG